MGDLHYSSLMQLPWRANPLSFIFVLYISAFSADRQAASPLSEVIRLLKDLSAKVTQEGNTAAKVYREYVAWCGSTTKQKTFEIKMATSQCEALEAQLDELSDDVRQADL